MTSSVSSSSRPDQDFLTPMRVWTHQNPGLAKITAAVFAVLGIAAAGAILMVASIPLAVILGLASLAALSTSGMLASFFMQQDVGGSSPNIPASDVAAQNRDLAQVMQDTLTHLKAGSYISPDGRHIPLDHTAAAQGTVLYLSGGAVRQRPGNESTRLILKDQDCLYAAADLQARGLNPLVLDMANGHHFGGGYLGGARAQEEDCCRRSGLCMAVDTQHGLQRRNFYPLANHSATCGIYVPDVTVFRAGYDRRYQCLNQPFKVAFGIVDATHAPPLENAGGRLRLTPAVAQTTREKIRTFFEMASQKGHQSVVFSALGCGAFCNPPDHIAEMTLEVLQQEFAHCFKEVVIAIIDDHNTGHAHNPEGNFRPFARKVLSANGSVINSAGQRVSTL